MRLLAAILGAAALFALATGCAKPSAVTAGGSGSASSGSASSGNASSGTGSLPSSTTATNRYTGPAMPGVHLPAGVTPVPGKQVDAHSLPASFPREVWTTQGGKVLGFYGEQGGCSTSAAQVTSQTATQVVVRFIQEEPGAGPNVCPMYLRYKPMSVSLASPLGTRTVVLQLAVIKG